MSTGLWSEKRFLSFEPKGTELTKILELQPWKPKLQGFLDTFLCPYPNQNTQSKIES